MKIANNLPQNGKEWLAWRTSGLGASDAPVIMGVSPFTSRFELWLEKTGLGERETFHPNAIKAMARGTLLEPEARSCYESKMKGEKFDAINVIHSEYDYIRASLDGYNVKLNRIVEIKCPGKIDLAEAAKGRVPKKYLPQVQLQLLLTGCSECDYFTYDGKDGIIVVVKADKVYQAELEKEMIAFWDLVQQKECPVLTQKDVDKVFKRQYDLQEKLKSANELAELTLLTFNNQKEKKND